MIKAHGLQNTGLMLSCSVVTQCMVDRIFIVPQCECCMCPAECCRELIVSWFFPKFPSFEDGKMLELPLVEVPSASSETSLETASGLCTWHPGDACAWG